MQNENTTSVVTQAVTEYLDRMFGEAGRANLGYRAIGEHAWHAGKAYSDAVTRANSWISVSDRLPVGHGVECLCFWNGHVYVDHYYDGSRCGEPGWEERTPTYWMPRPVDPQIDERAVGAAATPDREAQTA